MSQLLVTVSRIRRPLAWSLGVLLTTALVAGIFINPPQAQAQTGERACRVGIAVDRSDSVAVRNIRNPYFARLALRSLIIGSNPIDNPNVELGLWSFGTAVATPTNPNASHNPTYPFYAHGGSFWINTANNTPQQQNTWSNRINAIPMNLDRAGLAMGKNPLFWALDPSNYNPPDIPFPQYYNGTKELYNSVGGGIHSQNGNYMYYSYSTSGPTQLTRVADAQGNPVSPERYGAEGWYQLGSDTTTRVWHRWQDPAGATNWEAGLGRDTTGFIDGHGPNWELPIAAEADVIVLLTDAIEYQYNSSWYNQKGLIEPNKPTAANAFGLAKQAADYWRGKGKEIVVMSYAGSAQESDKYKALVGGDSNSNNILQIGEGADLRDIADRIEEIAETHCAAKPYLKVYGNDVRAGATFQPCHTGAPTAHIRTFARDITPTNLLWMGASVQHAVSATGNVEQFFSAGRRASLTNPTTPRPPNDLTFGNFNPPRIASFSPPPGQSGMARCIPDYAQTALDNGASDKSTGSSGTLNYINGPPSSPHNKVRPSLNNGERVVDVYVDNDVHIGGNITYSSTSWNNLEQIPSYTLIVKGKDIYIDNSVTELNGTYIALPDCDENGDCTGGRIFTCVTNARNVPSPTATGSGGMRQACTDKLTIRGSFIARQVRFHRVKGNVETCEGSCLNEEASSGNIAEAFDFSQEIYLAMPQSLRRGSNRGRYDSIISLPPVL